ncbi:MAG TPA: phosphate ABC transporter permease PstA [Candidatus Baltobacteraceae bacterium]|nr:phosphate ABC transporter permease PstA [Candidatus Baltobacteraceae bacterium]
MRTRDLSSGFGVVISALCAGLAAAILLLILGYVAREGAGALTWTYLSQIPRPVNVPGGGVANGIVGSFIIIGIAALIAVPIGTLAGIYLALYGRSWFAETTRFLADVLSGVPSIAIGLFAYTVFVAPFKHFSAVSASIAFAVLMLPLIIRTAEESISRVPVRIRESALAWGISSYAATIHIVVPAARSGMITGLLLALARVTGETAPLLFTAFGSQFWELNPTNPMAELSLQVFTYAISPYEDWHRQAWAGALLLIIAVFILNVGARFALRTQTRR